MQLTFKSWYHHRRRLHHHLMPHLPLLLHPLAPSLMGAHLSEAQCGPLECVISIGRPYLRTLCLASITYGRLRRTVSLSWTPNVWRSYSAMIRSRSRPQNAAVYVSPRAMPQDPKWWVQVECARKVVLYLHAYSKWVFPDSFHQRDLLMLTSSLSLGKGQWLSRTVCYRDDFYLDVTSLNFCLFWAL